METVAPRDQRIYNFSRWFRDCFFFSLFFTRTKQDDHCYKKIKLIFHSAKIGDGWSILLTFKRGAMFLIIINII